MIHSRRTDQQTYELPDQAGDSVCFQALYTSQKARSGAVVQVRDFRVMDGFRCSLELLSEKPYRLSAVSSQGEPVWLLGQHPWAGFVYTIA